MSASDQGGPPEGPPQSEEELARRGWDEQWKDAWFVFQEANEGDKVLYGDRVEPLTVTDVGTDSDTGLSYLVVRGPRGGTYTIREKYSPKGTPRYSADGERANDLRFEGRGQIRGISQPEYERIVSYLTEEALGAYQHGSYDQFGDAAQDVVGEWFTGIHHGEWEGPPHTPDYPELEPDVIDAVLTYTDDRHQPRQEDLERLMDENLGGGLDVPRWVVNDPSDELEAPRPSETTARAVIALTSLVSHQGHDRADGDHELLSAADGRSYDTVVTDLAQEAVGKFVSDDQATRPEEAYALAEEAVGDYIDRQPPRVHEFIVSSGDAEPFEEEGVYDLDDEEFALKERAYDVLLQDVWDEVESELRLHSEPRPEERGINPDEFDVLIGGLADDAISIYNEEDIDPDEAARRAIQSWADRVQAGTWEGAPNAEWVEGDTESIYQSVVTISPETPGKQVYFSQNPLKKAARAALQPLVEDEVYRAVSEPDGENDATPVPMDEYLQELLNDPSIDLTEALEPEDLAVETGAYDIEEEDVSHTFVDEIVAIGGTVPKVAGDWLLIDYGLVYDEGQDNRRLAWLNRETGDVVAMLGRETDETDEDGEDVQYWMVAITNVADDAMEVLWEDDDLAQTLEKTLSFLRDGNQPADLQIIDSDSLYVKDDTSPNIGLWSRIIGATPDIPVPFVELSNVNTPDIDLDIDVPGPVNIDGEALRSAGAATKGYVWENRGIVFSFSKYLIIRYTAGLAEEWWNMNFDPYIGRRGVGITVEWDYRNSSVDEIQLLSKYITAGKRPKEEEEASDVDDYDEVRQGPLEFTFHIPADRIRSALPWDASEKTVVMGLTYENLVGAAHMLGLDETQLTLGTRPDYSGGTWKGPGADKARRMARTGDRYYFSENFPSYTEWKQDPQSSANNKQVRFERRGGNRRTRDRTGDDTDFSDREREAAYIEKLAERARPENTNRSRGGTDFESTFDDLETASDINAGDADEATQRRVGHRESGLDDEDMERLRDIGRAVERGEDPAAPDSIEEAAEREPEELQSAWEAYINAGPEHPGRGGEWEEADDMGDYSIEDVLQDDEFGNQFEDVAEKFSGDERVDEGQHE